MPDFLTKLYDLPDAQGNLESLRNEKIIVRRAMAYEKFDVVEWVAKHFGRAWAGECDTAFSNRPISCFISTMNAGMLGFACYDSTMKNFFGPLGVDERNRNRGIGTALLLCCLNAMAAKGYAYAIIGGTQSAGFYEKTIKVLEIPGSFPGIYRDRLKG